MFAKLGRSVKIDRGVYFKGAKHIEIGKEAVICENVELLVEPGTQLKISDRVFIERDNRIIVSEKNSKLELGEGAYINTRTIITAAKGASIEVGANTIIGSFTSVSSFSKIKIGQDCLIASHCSIYAQNHVFADPTIPIREQGYTLEGIIIEDDCWLGTGVRVLDGVTIGKGSVIGAGAVVTKDIPPYSIAVGVPAKVIRQRTEQRSTERQQAFARNQSQDLY
ncbi:MAG: acyltransferase [Xenococcaceae cyanobacterium]